MVGLKMEFVDQFPPSEVENLPVWNNVLLRAFSHEACRRVESGIIGLTQKALTDWQKGGYKLGQVDTVVRITRFSLVYLYCTISQQCYN